MWTVCSSLKDKIQVWLASHTCKVTQFHISEIALAIIIIIILFYNYDKGTEEKNTHNWT